MKTTIPEHSVDVCDLCKQTGVLASCHVCGREFCLSHRGIVPGSYGFTTLCIECADRDDVKAVCDQHTEQLVPIFQARNEALRQLPKELIG